MAKKSLHFEIGNSTDVGQVRSSNEDSFSCIEPKKRKQRAGKGHLLIICDGMGGAVGGKTASSLAVDTVAEVYYKHKARQPSEALLDAINEANRRIHKRAREEPDLKGMGTTAVAAVLQGGELHLAHVGDSRCYLIRDGNISQLTEDHSLVRQMVKDGLITPEEARNHPESHILNRSVGVAPEVEVDVLQPPLSLQPDDKLVLCSDGLSGQVSDEEILAEAEASPAQQAVEKLTVLANERGGPDNITVQVVRIESSAPQQKYAAGATVRRMALRPTKRMSKWLIFLLLLTLIVAGVYFLWLFEIIDFGELLQQEWVPPPPKHLPPFK